MTNNQCHISYRMSNFNDMFNTFLSLLYMHGKYGITARDRSHSDHAPGREQAVMESAAASFRTLAPTALVIFI